MIKPDVSIIVPVYNVEKYLERCIKSLQNQTLRNIEIILVDDSATDTSPEICDAAAREDARIKVIHKVNEGAGMARNAALKEATGKYIGFVDSDDYVEPEMYETLMHTAEKYQSDLVMSGVLFRDGNMFYKEGGCTEKLYFTKDTHFESQEELKALRMGIIGARPEDEDDSRYGMSIWKHLFRNDVIQKNHLAFQSEREMLSEDALFMVDYIACIGKATGIGKAFYNYCRNEDSISKSYKKDRFEKSLVFISAVEERFKKDIAETEYSVYLMRFWQAMCRVICSQEIMHASENNIPYKSLKKNLKNVCTHPVSRHAFESYPLATLPFGQRIFAYAMKYRQYLLLKWFVALRNR